MLTKRIFLKPYTHENIGNMYENNQINDKSMNAILTALKGILRCRNTTQKEKNKSTTNQQHKTTIKTINTRD